VGFIFHLWLHSLLASNSTGCKRELATFGNIKKAGLWPLIGLGEQLTTCEPTAVLRRDLSLW
jgi:hypothetical protein